ncbi:putative galacturonosyltransferase 12 [Platanthera guangdongensis]|uniref:Hexosyltransferase n=1 Tax=Platanthera guangdongensis TaxID=2320717 RepID=A0ABR2LV53_9ASPA
MQAWFALHPLAPAVVEVRGLHHFDWFARGRVPVLEAMERDREARSQFRGGSAAIVASESERPVVVAAKLQALSPKYHSLMNHIRIYLPELFPSLKKVVFLDDDIVVQADLSPLWDIDLHGKLGTLPPGLIAFHGHVHTIDPYWHMLGLGYQENKTREDAEKAAVIHFNGRAKPWLDIAFPHLRPLWTKYIDFSDKYIKACNIRR